MLGDGRDVEIARYRVSEGERVLCRQWTATGIRVLDVPAIGYGPRFVVDELADESFLALRALVTDYLDQAADRDQIPATLPLIDPLS